MASCRAASGSWTDRDAGVDYSGAWTCRTAEKTSLAVDDWGARLPLRAHCGAKGQAPLISDGVVIIRVSEAHCALQSHMSKVLEGLLNRAGDPPPRRASGLCVDAALEGRVREDGAYGEFVDAVSSACSSPDAESLGVTERALFERRDPDNPRWIKLILRIGFADGDFASKRGRRIKLRDILNERIRVARIKSSAPERIDEIARRFFVTVRW